MSILIYCGVNECKNFEKIRHDYSQAIGFEANPSLAKSAKERYRRTKNARIIGSALAEDEGTVELNLYRSHVCGSLGKIASWRKLKLKRSPFKKTIQVESVNLELWCRRQKIDYIDFLVTDLEGMDYTVLKTMLPFLVEGRVKKIQCEVESDAHEEDAYVGLDAGRMSKFQSLLLPLGYKVVSENWRNKRTGAPRTFTDVTWEYERND